ncbi:hypothetical protein ACWGLF_17975 [Streptomyces puniciscabiei]
MEAIPEPRDAAPTAETADQPSLKRFPYDDGLSASQYLIHKMPPDQFNKMLDLLIKHGDSQAVSAVQVRT